LVVKSYFTQIAFADHLSFLNCQVARWVFLTIREFVRKLASR